MYLIRNTNLNYTVLFELPSKIVIKKFLYLGLSYLARGHSFILMMMKTNELQ